jgi:hypothetical protein
LDGKYVNLDLSACGGNIPGVAGDTTAENRPNRDKLVSLTLPESLTSIGYGAFLGCTSLASISLPSIITTIGPSTFYGFTSLVSLDLPDSLTSFGATVYTHLGVVLMNDKPRYT